MSEEKLRRDVSRALRAGELLADELLVEGFDTLEAAYLQMWRATRADQSEAREKLYLAVNVIGKLKDHLHGIIAHGRLAEAELKALTEDRDRRKRFGIV